MKFEANEEALATEKLGEIFESNRVGDSASLNALSATTKASNKVRYMFEGGNPLKESSLVKTVYQMSL